MLLVAHDSKSTSAAEPSGSAPVHGTIFARSKFNFIIILNVCVYKNFFNGDFSGLE
jgi:hypothetical protein